MEEWIRSERLYQGRILTLRVGEARLEDGTLAPREVVEHPGGVGVVPVLDDAVLLVRQFRISIGRPLLEIPAGRLEPGESPEHRARCELEEEVGCKAGRLVLVSKCLVSPGFTNQLDYVYLAFDLEQGEQRLEFDERIEIVRLPLADLDRMLDEGAFEDAKTIIGLRELQAYQRRNGNP
jgi:ADP-ribose pyrophosphatase